MRGLFGQKLLVRLAFALAVLVLPLYAYKVHLKTDYTDFSVYHRAAERALAGDWAHIYSLQDGASPFRYMPLTLPFIIPFGNFSLQTGSVVWYLLQYAWFLLGFVMIRRTLLAMQLPRDTANWITAASAIFILRFCLDSFTIGQISSLMFLAFTAGLYSWVEHSTNQAAGWLSIPTLLKIGPGIQMLLLPVDGPRKALRAWTMAALLLVGLSALTFLWLTFQTDSSWTIFQELWRGWIQIVLADSAYYDASHYGSQSLKSMLLRSANAGWFDLATASRIWATSTLVGCTGILLFWACRRPSSKLGRGLFFALGLFAYLWFMPETFKYALTTLAIPAALLFTSPRSKLSSLALIFGFLTLSLAGKDLIGGTLFFGLQQASIPLLSSFLLFLAVLAQAWRASKTAPWLQNAQGLLRSSRVGPWGKEPEPMKRAFSFILPVPIREEVLSRAALDRALRLIADVRRTLDLRDSEELEPLVVPYFETAADQLNASKSGPLAEAEPGAENSGFHVLPVPAHWGRGAALRHAFLRSRGRVILVTHFDQPCNGAFFKDALEAMELPDGPEFVSANRRAPCSRFRIPVQVLPLVYGRHRLGLLFNRLVRAALGIKTTDTHSGTFALTRSAAMSVFGTQSSPGFLFDLELFLSVSGTRIKHAELPVAIHLHEEKPFGRMIHETVSIMVGIPRLARRKRLGLYSDAMPDFSRLEVTADDWGMSPGVNDGILELARARVIRRVSLLADGSFLTYGLEELRGIPGIQLGIHFNLTYGKRHASPGRFLLEWVTRGIRPRRGSLCEYVRREFKVQLEKLRAAGVTPVYIDGHHHIHILPGVIRCLSSELKEAEITRTRLPYDPSLWGSSLAALLVMSVLSRKQLSASGLSFSKFLYPRGKLFDDPRELSHRLSLAEAGTEVIVHPASAADPERFDFPDDYVAKRVTEFLTLRQLRFKNDMSGSRREKP